MGAHSRAARRVQYFRHIFPFPLICVLVLLSPCCSQCFSVTRARSRFQYQESPMLLSAHALMAVAVAVAAVAAVAAVD